MGQGHAGLQKQENQSRKGIISLCSRLMKLHLELSSLFFSSQGMNDIYILIGVHQKKKKKRNLKHLMHKERLRNLGLLILE